MSITIHHKRSLWRKFLVRLGAWLIRVGAEEKAVTLVSGVGVFIGR